MFCSDIDLDPARDEYDQAKAHLEDCLTLAGNAHAIYMSLDDSLRRIRNQAFFDRINVYEVENTDTVDADAGEPFDTLFHPALHAAALADEARRQAGDDTLPDHVAGLNIEHWVGPAGLEPTTSTV